MKVGDLVRATTTHLLHRIRSCGIVVEHWPREDGKWAECLVVLWNYGEVELEVPQWLETISVGE